MKIFSQRAFVPDGVPHTPMLWPFWGPAPEPAEWRAMRRFDAYAARGAAFFELVDDPRAADVTVLPADWNRYVTSGRLDLMREFGAVAARAERPVVVFADTDCEREVELEGAIVFRRSLRRARRRPNEEPIPAWSGDTQALAGPWRARPWRARPVVGFCGSIGRRPSLGALMAWGDDESQAYALRRRALARLEACDAVETHFLRRRGYFGGTVVWRPAAQVAWDARRGSRLRTEYIENLAGSDYVLCVRGGGNFSYRFYETLACGRIPLFVDTDCVLPFEDLIDWRRHAVWCDVSRVAEIAEVLLDFHARLGPSGFADLQGDCRRLWERWLSPEGFFTQLPERLAVLARETRPNE